MTSFIVGNGVPEHCNAMYTHTCNVQLLAQNKRRHPRSWVVVSGHDQAIIKKIITCCVCAFQDKEPVYDKYAVFRELQMEEELLRAWKTPSEEEKEAKEDKSDREEDDDDEDEDEDDEDKVSTLFTFQKISFLAL
jgi:hypothetical protein